MLNENYVVYFLLLNTRYFTIAVISCNTTVNCEEREHAIEIVKIKIISDKDQINGRIEPDGSLFNSVFEVTNFFLTKA